MDRVSLSVVVVGAIVAYSALVVLGAIVVDARVFGVEGGDGDEIVVLVFVEEFVEDGVIVGVVESFEGSIFVVDGVEGVEGFVASSRSPQSREALRDEASSRGLFAIEWIVEGGLVVARRSSK